MPRRNFTKGKTPYPEEMKMSLKRERERERERERAKTVPSGANSEKIRYFFAGLATWGKSTIRKQEVSIRVKDSNSDFKITTDGHG
jgi:hypothetical protein